MNPANHPVLVVLAIAVIAPLLAEIPIGFRLPPLVLEICDIGLQTGRMRPDIAAALMGAATLSVLLFPMIAAVLLSRGAAPAATWLYATRRLG